MAELSPELRKLVPAYKSAHRPSDADSARVLEALRVRLGESAFLGTEAARVATTASKGLLLGKAAVMSVTGLAMAGGLWFLSTRSPHITSLETQPVEGAKVTSAPVALTPGIPSSSAPASIESMPSAVTVANAIVAQSETARPASARHTRDKLAEEVALLGRAQAALGSGKPALALDVLNAHERKFGHGLLAEERTAARIQALCALGRNAEANAQLAQLSSRSLHGRSAGQACSSRKNDGTPNSP